MRSLIFTLIWLFAVRAFAAGADEQVMRVGYQGRVTGLAREDVTVAVELWAKQVTAQMGLTLRPQILFYADADETAAALARQEIDVISLSVSDFLDLRERASLEPAFVALVDGESWASEFVVLVRKDRNIGALSDLRGADVVIESPDRWRSLPALWLADLVRDQASAEPTEFFGALDREDKAAPAILAVLFGRCQVAVVNRRAFQTMAELNPQVGNELAVLEQSPGMLVAVTCIPGYVTAEKRAAITEGAYRLHQYARGEQILTLFGAIGVIPFHPDHLASTERLLRDVAKPLAADGSAP